MPEEEVVKVKLGQLVLARGTQEAPGPLSNLMAVECFSVRVAYRLASLAKKVSEVLTPFDETKNKLIEKHGTLHKKLDAEGKETDKDERAKSMRPTDDAWPAFLEEYNALADEEVDLDIEPVVLPPDAEGVTGGTLLALDGLVTVRGEKDEKPALKIAE